MVNNEELVQDVLAHHGIKGMKWGRRRFQNKDGSLTDAGRKRYDDDPTNDTKYGSIGNTLRKRRSDKSEDDSKDGDSAETKPKKKSIEEMTDEELRAGKARYDLEKAYKDSYRNAHQEEAKAAEEAEKEKKNALPKKFWDEAAKPAIVNAGKELLTNFMLEQGKKILGLNAEPPAGSFEALKRLSEKFDLEQKISNAKKTIYDNDRHMKGEDTKPENLPNMDERTKIEKNPHLLSEAEKEKYRKQGWFKDSDNDSGSQNSNNNQNGKTEKAEQPKPSDNPEKVTKGKETLPDIIDNNKGLTWDEILKLNRKQDAERRTKEYYDNLSHSELKSVLAHHGVKGQKWGVRRYQFTDGSLTPAGRKRYNNDSTGVQKAANRLSMKVSELRKSAATKTTGKQLVDTYLAAGTTLARIQTSKNFENFAFYATYTKSDSNKYMGLFGKNLRDRAAADAKKAEKLASETGDEADIKTAKEARDYSDNLKVYQLKLETTKKLRIPSDDNAADITAKLLKEPDFKENVAASLADSKAKMKRPQQQLLFDQAQKAMDKDPDTMTRSEKSAIYKAFNLSLTNHNAQEIAAQNRFYGELKKKGYSALLDYNDREYSSYHAKRPTIVFDTDAVKLQSVTETNPKVVNMLYTKYNVERKLKEIPANTTGLIARVGTKTVSEASSYVKHKMDKFMK